MAVEMAESGAGSTKAPLPKLKQGKPNRNHTNVKQIDFLQNMSNAEVSMIHRLAGNNPEVRKSTIKKLRKWLKAIAAKIPDSLESRVLVEANFARVWKALFYCMWMADKPLPQETLAEQISNFISIFSEKPNLMMHFVEWFFLTFIREWPWIDRLRMDKFMMLIRRFLRKLLQEFSRLNWEDEHLDPFLNILTVHLFNHHPVPKSKKQAKLKRPDPPKAPLGFQIHIVDIFLEELSKVGAVSLESSQILKIISPLVNEMSVNDDDRLLDEIKQRVFHHLMRQSDVGIDYVESHGGAFEMMELDENESEPEADDNDNELTQHQSSIGPLDPRAGAVDVMLPQLQVDYEQLIDLLTAAASREGVRARNKKGLLGLVRQFQSLTQGEFPLGAKRERSRIPAIKRSEIEAAANRLNQMESSLKDPKLKRKNKKERQAELQEFSEPPNESIGSEDDSSFLKDSNLMDHVGENYDAYLGQMQNGKTSSSPKDRTQKSPIDADLSPPKSPRKIKTGKRKVNSVPVSPVTVTTRVDTIAEEAKVEIKNYIQSKNDVDNGGGNSNGETYITIKRRRSEPGITSENKVKKGLTEQQLSKMYSSLVGNEKTMHQLKSPKEFNISSPHIKRKSQSLGSQDLAKNNRGSKTPATPLTNNKRASLVLTKTIAHGEQQTLSNPGSRLATPSSGKKKVNFVLTKNVEHEHSDYKESIHRSPAIPYDGTRRPSFGLLKKSPVMSTPSSPRKRLLNHSFSGGFGSPATPRRKAMDFF